MNDIKDELRSRLGDYVNQVTTPSRRAGKNMFVCPLCGSGSKGGRDSDGAFHLSGDRWYCHACQKGGDIFTLYAEINQLDTVNDFPEINTGLAQALGVTVIDSAKRDFTPERKEVRQEVKQINPERVSQIESFASQLAGSPAETYLRERGFSDEIIKKYRLGYDQAKNAVVIPYPGTDYFTKRLIAPAEGQNKYDNLPGEAPTFMIRESTSDYAQQKNQIGRFDVKLLDTPNNKNEETIILEGYLRRRILAIKGSSKLSPTILYETVYKQLDLSKIKSDSAMRNKTQKIRDSVKKALDYFKKEGFIKGYVENSHKGDKNRKVSVTIRY